MSTQPVGIGGRVSAMHASQSLSSRTFSSSIFCISSSLALLTISGFSGSPVLLSQNSWACCQGGQQLQVLQSRSSFQCGDCKLSISSHQPFGASRGSHAPSQRTHRRHQSCGILFTSFRSAVQQLYVIVSTKTASVHGLRGVVMNPVALRADPTFPASSTEVIPNRHRSHRTLRMPSIANNSFRHGSFHDVAAQGCSKRTRPPRSTCGSKLQVMPSAALPFCLALCWAPQTGRRPSTWDSK